MERLAYLVIGGALGMVLTLILKAPQPIDPTAMPAMEMEAGMKMGTDKTAEVMSALMPAMHQHPLRNVSPDKPIPNVTHLVFPDIMGGYNVQIIPKNFEFTPAAINREVKDNQGHAHIYVNGVKVSRVYSKWYHLSSTHLKSGENTVSVTLNANDHSEWAVDGANIKSSVRVIKAD